MAVTKYQKFESVTINREKINNAPYNPRKLSEEAEKKLRKNIKKNGFMGGIVVNSRTNNLISGHQRIMILDSLERKKDYEITVNMVSLSEKEEKEQNIFFNNPYTQGEFDTLKLKDLFDDFDLDIDSTGFEINDLVAMDITENEFINENPAIADINKIKEAKKKHREKKRAESDTNHFICLLFGTVEEKEKFCVDNKLDVLEQYIKFDDFIRLIKSKK